MPLHPDLEAFLEMVNLQPHSLSEMTPTQARAMYDISTLSLDMPGADVQTETVQIHCRDGHHISGRLYSNPNENRPQACVLFFHGGGYVLGGLESHDSLCRDIAHLSPCAVLAIDYRLAPEYQFPTAFHDAEDARLWLLTHGEQLGLDCQRLIYAGDSVGGSLATALALADKAAGRPQPQLQLLLYPCTGSALNTASHQRYAEGFLLEHKTLQWMFALYLRSKEDWQDWRFAPLTAEQLEGLAPAHIVLAEYDPLIDEGNAYADRLRTAGVPITIRIYPGMVHDFARLGNIVDDTRQLRNDLATILAGALQ